MCSWGCFKALLGRYWAVLGASLGFLTSSLDDLQPKSFGNTKHRVFDVVQGLGGGILGRLLKASWGLLEHVGKVLEHAKACRAVLGWYRWIL